MRPALALFGYALAVSWCLPPLLARLTGRGVSRASNGGRLQETASA